MQAAMAALPQSLTASGNPSLVVAGGAFSVVNVALTAHMASQVDANRQALSDDTEERLRRLEAKADLDEDMLKRPEFRALVFQAAVAAAQESDKSKIDWYAAILAGAASRGRPPDLNVQALLSSMTFLTAEEMRLARQFYQEFDQSKYSIVDGAPTPSWGPDTGLYLRRLETANLIVPHIVQGLPAGFQASGGNYFVTDTFHRLMALVRETEP
ncbi:MAG TPA: hypothetical protein DEV93_14925 [Chloroflexi bacterium]|jgi:hypothetical protein|nr:hypothetical protein [Chloroflexota bacterium]HCG01821.1 hypothetical protein [Chloroflexota bacterium]